MSLDIVQGDIVAFNKGYRDIVQAGETHPIDKIIKVDGKVQGIYIKLDFTWIYMSVEMFNDYCKVIRTLSFRIYIKYEKRNQNFNVVTIFTDNRVVFFIF
jgi:hypothetical protein